SDIYNKFYKEMDFNEYDLDYFYFADFDNNGNLWSKLSSKSILSVRNDTTKIYSQVYNTLQNKFFDIEGIWDLKIDKKGDVWTILQHFCYVNDTNYHTYYSLSKFKDSCFVTVNNITTPEYGKGIKRRMTFDNLGRVWHSNKDTLFCLENELVVKRVSTFDFPEGYSSISEIVVNSKGVVYILNYNLVVFKLDGDKYTKLDSMWETEKYINHREEKTDYYMRIDSSDNVWISGPTYNLYKIDTTDRFTRIEIPNPGIEGFLFDKKDFQVDTAGKLWIICDMFSSSSWGIYIFDPDGVVSVEEQMNFTDLNENNISIYPNPASNYVNINFKDNYLNENIEISLYNSLGLKVKDISNYGFDKTISFSVEELPNGIYFIHFEDGKSVISKPIIISK
nr:T9SS type A sorting domain-containing protein [Candidatus Kapabacteria bacterium]